MSVTAGTIFQDSHLPLTIWFRAMWQVTSQKNGISALGLQRVLGLGSYKTAWAMLHKLRRAMVRPGRERLAGIVEVDETYLGGRGRRCPWSADGGQGVDYGGGRGRRQRHRADPSAMHPGLDQGRPARVYRGRAMEPGSTVRTDGWNAYRGVDAATSMTSGFNAARNRREKLLPRVHRVISLLKRWLLGTHQGAIGHHHLDDYLDEFTFRFNRRTSASRGKLFYRLAQQAVQVDPAPFAILVKPQPIASGGVK